MDKGSRKIVWFIAILLVAATLAVYGQVRHHEFIRFDEEVYVTANAQVLQGLTLANLHYAFTSLDAGLWHPLTWLSLMADRQLFGDNAGGYHLTNLLFHLASTLLLFFLFLRMTGAPWRSGCVAALFALHPLHVESVAWVAQRKDVLSAFFWMLTLGAYVRYARRPSWYRYLLVLLVFLLGLMAKPMLVTLPFVLLLLDYWPLGRFARPDADTLTLSDTDRPEEEVRVHRSPFFLLLEKVPLLILAFGAGLMAVYAEGEVGAMVSLGSLPLGTRLANALVSYGDYLVKMVWPFDLAVFYPHPGHPPMLKIILAAALLCSLTFLALKWAKSRPYLVMGWLWYAGTLLPVSGIVQVGSHGMADRYTYLPLLGIFIILSWGIPELLPRQRRTDLLLGLLAGSSLLFLMFLAAKQTAYWQNSETLFRHSLAVTSRNYLIHNNFGAVLMSKGDLEGAMAHYIKALAFKPGYAVTHNNLGNAFVVKGDHARARQHFQEALRIKPDYGRAHRNFGDLLMRMGATDEALVHYRRALFLLADDPELHNNIGVALASKGKIAAGVGHMRRALELKKDFSEAKTNLEKLGQGN